jgi:CheY-like chemotaxis protein/HD-like signal output (HDOD) protein
MNRILVVDDMPIIREPLVQALRATGYDAVGAESGPAALAAVTDTCPKLILLDVRMPDMDGLQLLDVLRKTETTRDVPVLLLTEDNSKSTILDAAKLGIQGCLLKSHFSLPTLLKRIEEHLTPTPTPTQPPPSNPRATDTAAAKDGGTPPATGAKVPPAKLTAKTLLTRDDCIERAKNALSGQTISGAVGQVIAMAASPRSDTSQLATLIARDPMLSARILHAANSAAYASQKGVVTTIPEAIRNIGVTTVRNIAAAIGIIEVMPAATAGGYHPIRCWQHSFAVAQLCERLCARAEPENAGVAYLVGLCHDLGEILFHSHFEQEYAQVLAVHAQTGGRREHLERQMLGMTHGELVLTILQQLGLPDTIRLPIEGMHASREGTTPSRPLSQILYLADMYANGSLLASSETSPIAPLPQAICKKALGEAHPDTPDSDTLRNDVYALTGLLARLPAPDETALMRPLYDRRTSRVCVVRAATLSSYDPIFNAIDSMARATLSPSLPAKHELEAFDGVVIISPDQASRGLTPIEINAWAKSAGPARRPVLWLSGETSNNPTPEIQTAPFPLPLATLARFIQTLSTPPSDT